MSNVNLKTEAKKATKKITAVPVTENKLKQIYGKIGDIGDITQRKTAKVNIILTSKVVYHFGGTYA